MRQNNNNNHNKNRMRGRGRKGPNPMSRSFESNGPDVKIRGNAAHIAEKYANLARDAQVAGDRILAESYYQYAEHYNRIVFAAQQAATEQQQIQQQQQAETASATNDEDRRPDAINGNADSTSEPAHAKSVETGANGADADEVQSGRARAPRPRRGRRGPRVKMDNDSETADVQPTAQAVSIDAPQKAEPDVVPPKPVEPV